MSDENYFEKIDFRSGCSMKNLSKLVNIFDDYDRHEFDDQMALEVHAMKEHIFNILGEVQKLDQKLPAANEYLLLSGNARDGTVDIDVESPGGFTRGSDYDLDYTLYVPVLKLQDRNQTAILDMRHSSACHTWLSLKMFCSETVSRWESCCCTVEQDAGTCHYLSTSKVCDWFHEALYKVTEEMKKNPEPCSPSVVTFQRTGIVTTIILAKGGTRISYDVLPVVSFRGWPAVAMGWLSERHFWDETPLLEGEIISGFHLVPSCGLSGNGDMEWRLSFARSEVQLKRYIPTPFMKTFYAYKAVMNRALGRYTKVLKPYVLRSLLFWACDRVKLHYLASEDTIAECFLGLIDDTLQCLLSRSCPNCFIPQCNMIGHLDNETVLKLCQVVLMACHQVSCQRRSLEISISVEPTPFRTWCRASHHLALQLTTHHVFVLFVVFKLVPVVDDLHSVNGKVRSDPAEHVRNAVDQMKAARQQTKEYRDIQIKKFTLRQDVHNDSGSSANNVEGNSRQELDLASKVRRLVDSNPGKSISVFLNPEDSSESHFRIDGKFF